MVDFIRRSAWTLLLSCVAVTMAADSYHPHIVKSEVVSLDVKAIEANAKSGTPFDLVFGETQLSVVLSPAPVWPEEGLRIVEIQRDDTVIERVVHGVITYAGDVAGEDPQTSEARFTIANGVLKGYVLSRTGWWFIEPLSRFDPKAGADQFLVYATRDLDFALPFNDEDVEMDEVYYDPYEGDGRFPIAMIADREYVQASGGVLAAAYNQAFLLNAVNGIYRDQTGFEFRFRTAVADEFGVHLTSRDKTGLLDQLDRLIAMRGGVEQGLKSELAHLTTAKDMGGVGGVARFGTRAWSQQIFIYVSGGGSGGTSLDFQNMMLASHEIGHNFNGRHDRAEKWCVTAFITCLDYERSLMWETFYNDNNPRFSDGHPDPDLNNRHFIRTNMRLRIRPWL